MNTTLDVVVVGAGPYGLSLAAHLRAAGLKFRIFGKPMSTWSEHMPAGMFLKSDGFASNLSDPAGSFTLKRFCEETGEPYEHQRLPVRLETFCAYGLNFQQRAVPNLERKWVTSIEKTPEGFQVGLEDGELLTARKVVLAVGITHFDFLPPDLKHLPAGLVSHSSLYGDVSKFRGRSVAVIGGGASACDLAVTLASEGVDVTIITRAPVVYFGEAPTDKERPLWQQLRHPSSGIGSSLRSRIYADAPWLVHYFPQRLRSRIVKRHLGPAASWTVKDRIVGHIPLWVGTSIRTAEPREGKVHLNLSGPDGTEKSHVTDHVIAATGYRPNVHRLGFLSEQLRSQLRTVDDAPILSRRFESSVRGLYFVGVASAASFGPVMRFAFGADYTARSLSRHLADSAAYAVSALHPAAGHE